MKIKLTVYVHSDREQIKTEPITFSVTSHDHVATHNGVLLAFIDTKDEGLATGRIAWAPGAWHSYETVIRETKETK